jgi:hypothetical protein
MFSIFFPAQGDIDTLKNEYAPTDDIYSRNLPSCKKISSVVFGTQHIWLRGAGKF